jgi:FixJ family two-component response regulator
MATGPVVCLVDDDQSVRESLAGLLRSVGLQVGVFASAEEFLRAPPELLPACLILDVTMPGMTGADLQERLLTEGRNVPIIFITARAEAALRARVLELGAVAYLVKPFAESELLDAVDAVLRSQKGSA